MKIVLLSLVILATLLAAGVYAAAEISDAYGPGTILTGTVTLNLSEVPGDSNFTARFGSSENSVKLIDFLNASRASFKCNPADCENTYTISNPQSSKVVSTTQYLAIVIPPGTNISRPDKASITSLMFHINGSNAGLSCGVAPITIDILDDSKEEWPPAGPESSDDYCMSLNPSAAYESKNADYQSSISSEQYCEIVELIPASKFKVAADIINFSEDAGITMTLSNAYDTGSCELEYTPGNVINYSCEMELTVREKGKYYLCISGWNVPDKAKIKIETTSPNCGGMGVEDFTCDQSQVDYALYVQPSFYKTFTGEEDYIASETLAEINAYLDKKYKGYCSAECIIPIKLNLNQLATLSNLKMEYRSATGLKETKNFYNAKVVAPKINMSEQTLQVGAAKFIVPSVYGQIRLSLLLGGKLLVEKDITVAMVPDIKSITPTVVFAETTTEFSAVVISPKKNVIVSYSWDFGDGSLVQTTTTARISHKYSLGDYSLTLTATDIEGLSSSRIVRIVASTPKAAVESTIATKKQNLVTLTNVLRALPAWYTDLIPEELNTYAINRKLSALKDRFKEPDADYAGIQSELNLLIIPYELREDNIETVLSDGADLSYIAKIEDKALEDEATLKEAVKKWQKANIQMREYYTAKEVADANESVVIATEYKLEIKSWYGDKFYLVIVPPMINRTRFSSNYSEYEMTIIDNGAVFTLSGDAIINFAVEGKVMPEDVMIFTSPKLGAMADTGDVICGDGVCDTVMGEDYSSCPEDCGKPYGTATTYILVILIVLALSLFVIWRYYAALYDRRLKASLFKNLDDFNKITFFIANEKNKNKEKEEIKEKLKTAGWTAGQINYAIQKVEQNTKRMQRSSILNFVTNELKRGKTEEDIGQGLVEIGWESSMIEWAIKKAKKAIKEEKAKAETLRK